MEGLSQLLQSGGSDAMGLINNQSGGAIQAVTLAISVLFPILFFVISKIVHDNLDEERLVLIKEHKGWVLGTNKTSPSLSDIDKA